MTKLSIAELHAFLASYIDATKIAQSTFTPTYESTAGLLDKIAKTFIIDGIFEDKLPELDGDFLGLAKNLEEYYANLIMPTDDDRQGANALAPAPLTYMPASYSYSLGRKKFKDTRYNDDLESTFTNETSYLEALDMITKRLWDSYGLFKFDAKKELLACYGAQAITAMTTGDVFAANTAYAVGKILKDASTATAHGIVVKAVPSSGGPADWATAVSQGYIIIEDLVSDIAVPTDTETGEAFIKEVKKYVRKSKFVTEGNSLNGNTLGATEGLLLVVNTSIIPSLEVDTWAGAFHKEDAMFDVETKEIDDFGSDTNGIYAMLIDRRGCKLHNSYQAVRTQLNADGDFQNYVLHTDNTAAYSRNTFLHIFKH